MSLEANMNGYNIPLLLGKNEFFSTIFIPQASAKMSYFTSPSKNSTPFVNHKEATFIGMVQNNDNRNTVKYCQVRKAKLT